MSRLCKDCVSGYALPGKPKGTMEKNGAYFSSAPTSTTESGEGTSSKRAVVLLTDAFGFGLPNPKIMADKYAEELKCDVFVPDIFLGHPIFTSEELEPYTPDRPNQTEYKTIWNRLGFVWAMVRNLPGLITNRPAAVQPRAEEFVRALRKSSGYSKIGVVGYCFGGGLTLGLSTKPDLIDAAVSAHPGPLTMGYVNRCAVPLALICAEEDTWMSEAQRNECEAALKRKTDIPSEVLIHKGVTHGFATRPNLGIPDVKEEFEKAFDEAVAWFQKHL